MKLDPMQVAGGLIVGGLVGWWLGRRQVAVVTTTVPVIAAGGQVVGQINAGDAGSWPPSIEDGRRLVMWNVHNRSTSEACDRWRSASADLKQWMVRSWWDDGASGNFNPNSYRSVGMDIAHPGWEQEYIRVADAYCVGQPSVPQASQASASNVVVGAPYLAPVPDEPILLRSRPVLDLSETTIARWMGAHRLTCESWMSFPNAVPVGPYYSENKSQLATLFYLDQFPRQADAARRNVARIISAIDAHCAKVLYAPKPVGRSNTRYAKRLIS